MLSSGLVSEEIRQVVHGVNVGNGNLMVLDAFAHVEVTSFDVFDLLVMLGVVRRVARGRVVTG